MHLWICTVRVTFRNTAVAIPKDLLTEPSLSLSIHSPEPPEVGGNKTRAISGTDLLEVPIRFRAATISPENPHSTVLPYHHWSWKSHSSTIYVSIYICICISSFISTFNINIHTYLCFFFFYSTHTEICIDNMMRALCAVVGISLLSQARRRWNLRPCHVQLWGVIWYLWVKIYDGFKHPWNNYFV